MVTSGKIPDRAKNAQNELKLNFIRAKGQKKLKIGLIILSFISRCVLI